MVRRAVFCLVVGLLLSVVGPSFAADITPPPLPPPAATDPVPPPLPPPEPAAQYYAAESGKPVGPMSLDQLKARVQNNQTKRTDLVWKAGSPAWMPAEQLAELKDAFGAAPPDMPQEAQWKDFMIGVWEAAGSNPQGYDWVLRLSYMTDGRYGGYQTLMSNGLSSQQPASGTWTTTPAGQNKFSLTLKPQGGMANTVVLTVIDQNTVFNEAEGYYAKRLPQ